MSAIVLCPGQGAQAIGMGLAWAEKSPAARSIFERADARLGWSLSTLCFEGPEDQLARTDIAQAAIYATSVACAEGLRENGLLDDPAATAGLSLGEFTALHLAGAFDFEDGLMLVRLRGEAMQDAAEAVSSGMVALMGAEEEQARELCDAVRGDDVLTPANLNCPGQVVISGSTAACERAAEQASSMGLKATVLKVAGAFHSQIMAPAAERLEAALEEVAWSAPLCPVLSNVTAQPHAEDVASIKARLVEQLTQPVRWGQSMQWASANLSGEYIELAPGKVLSGLMRRIDRQIKVTNHAEPS